MRVAFFHSDKPREHLLADAFLEGVKRHGDPIAMVNTAEEPTLDYEVACMVGVKSRELFQKHWRAGIHTVYLDKGYSRHKKPGPVSGWEFWRMAIDSHQPTEKYRNDCPDDRMKECGWEFKPWRKKGHKVIIAGSSEKYHAFYGLNEPTEYATRLIHKIKKRAPQFEIVYRPKPSWAGAVEITGAHYSIFPETISDALKGGHVMITHGSNACFEAATLGIPALILGNAASRPISSTSFDDLESPYLATDLERKQLFSYLAYCQYSLVECSKGQAWAWIRPQIYE